MDLVLLYDKIEFVFIVVDWFMLNFVLWKKFWFVVVKKVIL